MKQIKLTFHSRRLLRDRISEERRKKLRDKVVFEKRLDHYNENFEKYTEMLRRGEAISDKPNRGLGGPNKKAA